MDKWVGKVAVITGATEGMGNLLCKELVKAGVVVVGVARQIKKLKVSFFFFFCYFLNQ